VIYERLGPSGKLYAPETKEHLDDYSQAGLRTLCFAFRVIDPAEYKTWSKVSVRAREPRAGRRGKPSLKSRT
jgi:phospholipid-translocating ATPase